MFQFSSIRLCPRCDAQIVHRSRRRGVIEKCLFPLLLILPFRCDQCDFRYFGYVHAKQIGNGTGIQTVLCHPVDPTPVSPEVLRGSSDGNSISAPVQA
jgi:hypothetical protein